MKNIKIEQIMDMILLNQYQNNNQISNNRKIRK